MDEHERTVDRLIDGLTSALMPIAQHAERIELTAPSPALVDLVVELDTLVRLIVGYNQRVMTGSMVEWGVLADKLAAVARHCRTQMVINASDRPPPAD